MARSNISVPVQTAACITHLVVDVARVRDALCHIGGMCRDLGSNNAFLYVIHVWQTQMLAGVT